MMSNVHVCTVNVSHGSPDRPLSMFSESRKYCLVNNTSLHSTCTLEHLRFHIPNRPRVQGRATTQPRGTAALNDDWSLNAPQDQPGTAALNNDWSLNAPQDQPGTENEAVMDVTRLEAENRRGRGEIGLQKLVCTHA